MTVLLYTYTDWQCRMVPMLEAALRARGEKLFWIGRRSPGINSAVIRGVPTGNPFKRVPEFEATGPLPTLADPIAFEKAYLSSYMYQMNRYAKGYGSRGHDMKYFHEYRDHFHLTARRFKRLLLREEVTSVIFINMPHTGDDYLLYRVAEDMGLKVTMFMVSPFKNKFFSTPSIESYGLINEGSDITAVSDIEMDVFDRQVKSTVQSYMFGVYRSGGWNLRDAVFAVLALLRRYPGFLLEPGRMKTALLEVMRLRRSLKKNRRTRQEMLSGHRTKMLLDWLAPLERDTSGLPEMYVYFPLHFQPELTTVPQGGVFGDQALAIEMLSAALPKDVAVVVKENPMQGAYHREKTFADRLRQLENVVVMHPSVSNEMLEQNCLAVGVVTGTAGWEAIRDGRPCICFGHAWYLDCPGVHAFDDGFDLQHVVQNPPIREASETFLGKVIARAHTGVVYEFFLDSDDAEVEARNFETLVDLLVKLTFGEVQTTFAARQPAI